MNEFRLINMYKAKQITIKSDYKYESRVEIEFKVFLKRTESAAYFSPTAVPPLKLRRHAERFGPK